MGLKSKIEPDPDPHDWEGNVFGQDGVPPLSEEELDEMARYYEERQRHLSTNHERKTL